MTWTQRACTCLQDALPGIFVQLAAQWHARGMWVGCMYAWTSERQSTAPTRKRQSHAMCMHVLARMHRLSAHSPRRKGNSLELRCYASLAQVSCNPQLQAALQSGESHCRTHCYVKRAPRGRLCHAELLLRYSGVMNAGTGLTVSTILMSHNTTLHTQTMREQAAGLESTCSLKSMPPGASAAAPALAC